MEVPAFVAIEQFVDVSFIRKIMSKQRLVTKQNDAPTMNEGLGGPAILVSVFHRVILCLI